MTEVEEQLESEVMRRVQSEVTGKLGGRGLPRLSMEDQPWLYRMVGEKVTEVYRDSELDDPEVCPRIWKRVFGQVAPLGSLVEFLSDPDVEEIRFNGPGKCYVISHGRRQPVESPVQDEEQLIRVIQSYIDADASIHLDRSNPMVTMTMPDGSRLHAVLSPPARPLSVTIRRHSPNRFGCLEDLVVVGTLPRSAVSLLELAVRARLNVLVAGGTSTGKTTFVRLLAGCISQMERVVTIEDQAELHLTELLEDCIALEGRPANSEGRGSISIQRLVYEALRMSPDRIIIGEVRGIEALDMLDAMNTGHPGSLCTLHSESPRETVSRLIRLVLRNPQAPRAEVALTEVARTVDLILHLGVDGRDGHRQRVLNSAAFVCGLEAGQVLLDEFLQYQGAGRWRWHRAQLVDPPQRIADKLSVLGMPADCLAALVQE